MENTPRPTITIPVYNINATNNTYKGLITLTNEDHIYLNIWREKARKLYKKYNGICIGMHEKYLVDPDPFECKWFIFRIKPKSHPAPSPCLSVISFKMNDDTDLINQDLIDKFTLNP
jgi:hypothetical protein